MSKLLFLLPVIGILFSACAPQLSPYTQKLQTNSNLTEDELKQIQFYLSHDVVLYRTLSNSETSIFKGELKVVNGEKVEEVIIPAGTPGLVIGKQRDALMVSFDNDDSYLRFAPYPGVGGKYTLMAKDWDGKTGHVDYDGKEYKTSATGSTAYLLLDVDKKGSVTINSKEAPGRKL